MPHFWNGRDQIYLAVVVNCAILNTMDSVFVFKVLFHVLFGNFVGQTFTELVEKILVRMVPARESAKVCGWSHILNN